MVGFEPYALGRMESLCLGREKEGSLAYAGSVSHGFATSDLAE